VTDCGVERSVLTVINECYVILCYMFFDVRYSFDFLTLRRHICGDQEVVGLLSPNMTLGKLFTRLSLLSNSIIR